MSKTFAERLKAYRMEKLWTLQQMATLTGLAPDSIWRLENGHRRPHDLTRAKLKRALPDFDESPSPKDAA